MKKVKALSNIERFSRRAIELCRDTNKLDPQGSQVWNSDSYVTHVTLSAQASSQSHVAEREACANAMQAVIARALLLHQNPFLAQSSRYVTRCKSSRARPGIGSTGKGGERENAKLEAADTGRKNATTSPDDVSPQNIEAKANQNLGSESKPALSDTPPSGFSAFSEAAASPFVKDTSIEGQTEKAKKEAYSAPTPPPLKPFSLDFSPPELEQDTNAQTEKSSSSSTGSSSSGPSAPLNPNIKNSSLPGLSNITTENTEPGQSQRTGARSSKGSLSSIEKKRRNALRAFLLLGGVTLGATVVYMGRPWDEDELRSRAGVDKIFTEPVWEELLPPQIPGEERPYTLVLSVDDLLVTSTWDRQHGWRTAKRPGVDYFLNYLSQWFEIVIFTTNQYYLTDQILEKLDPFRSVIAYKLYRESTRYHDGHVVKDISNLNRDLSKVITIDTHAEHYSQQPDNAIIVPSWKGEANDKGLVGLIPFLESIGIYAPQDVRPILSAYRGKDIITEYAKVEAEQKKRHVEAWLRSGGSKKEASSSSLFGRLSGSSFSSTAEQQPKPPLTFLERKRLEAQYNYMLDERHKKANEKEIMAYFKAVDEANMKAIGAGSLSGFIKSWSQPPPIPEAVPPPKIVYLPPLPPPPELVNAGYFGERGISGKR